MDAASRNRNSSNSTLQKKKANSKDKQNPVFSSIAASILPKDMVSKTLPIAAIPIAPSSFGNKVRHVLPSPAPGERCLAAQFILQNALVLLRNAAAVGVCVFVERGTGCQV